MVWGRGCGRRTWFRALPGDKVPMEGREQDIAQGRALPAEVGQALALPAGSGDGTHTAFNSEPASCAAIWGPASDVAFASWCQSLVKSTDS